MLENLELSKEFPFEIFSQTHLGSDEMPYLHCHNYLEISLVESGGMFYILEGRTILQQPGDVMILNNLEPHRVRAGDHGCLILVLVFYPELVWSGMNPVDFQYLETFFSEQNNFENFIPSTLEYASAVGELIREIRRENAERQEGYRLMIKAKLLSLLTVLFRNHAVKAAPVRNSFHRFEALTARLRTEFTSPVTLTDCAERCGLSPQYFSTLFHEAFGMPFSVFLNRLRIAKAMELLKTTDLSVREIAEACGFRNMSNFSKMFLRETKKTATQFRKD